MDLVKEREKEESFLPAFFSDFVRSVLITGEATEEKRKATR